MSQRKHNTFRPSITLLENREMPSVSSITLSAGVLTVRTNSASSSVLVSQPATTIQIRDVSTNRNWIYSPNAISKVEVIAGSGYDIFTATTTHPATAKLVEFVGGSGTDNFIADSGNVSMQAGSGTDSLTALTGNDTLIGGGGTDIIKGGSGNNVLTAGTGNDYLNGGTGTSTITGGIGNDTIVAINGLATDVVNTGIGTEIIWVDSIGGVTDTINGSTAGDTIQAVTGFANPGATSVLSGGTFKEPTVLPGNSYEAFTNRPLFASGGPTVSDVKQYVNAQGGTNLTDSWLLAGLAAIAQEDPTTIQDDVVDFGDGTYGVKLGDKYYRVDDELPVNVAGETYTAYASLGQQGSMWVAIVEKAFAYYATPSGTPSYMNLEAVNGLATTNLFTAFGATSVGSVALNGIGGFPNANDLGQAIVSRLNAGYSTTIGLTSTLMGTNSSNATVTLAANREYTVLSYTEGFNGTVTSVVLRDPDGVNSDGITVTLTNLYAATGTLDFGNP